MTNNFERLILDFEQSHLFSAYLAIQEGGAEGDDYIKAVIKKNDLVLTQFINTGEKGVEYLVSLLSKGGLDLQERAIMILGKVGRNYSGELDIRASLQKQLKSIYNSSEVKDRITYSIQQLDEFDEFVKTINENE